MSKKYIIFFILLAVAVIGCQKEKEEWNPVFEETGFNYFYKDIDRSLSLIDEAYQESEKGNQEAVQTNLNAIKHRLLEIKDYYVPLTAIRQKIYDAERFFKLKNIKKAESLLNDAKSVFATIDLKTQNKAFDKMTLDFETTINGVLLSLDKSSESDTYNKIKLLGEHINLMLLKGDLVLSGIEFYK